MMMMMMKMMMMMICRLMRQHVSLRRPTDTLTTCTSIWCGVAECIDH
jgi:hypothetical protein